MPLRSPSAFEVEPESVGADRAGGAGGNRGREAEEVGRRKPPGGPRRERADGGVARARRIGNLARVARFTVHAMAGPGPPHSVRSPLLDDLGTAGVEGALGRLVVEPGEKQPHLLAAWGRRGRGAAVRRGGPRPRWRRRPRSCPRPAGRRGCAPPPRGAPGNRPASRCTPPPRRGARKASGQEPVSAPTTRGPDGGATRAGSPARDPPRGPRDARAGSLPPRLRARRGRCRGKRGHRAPQVESRRRGWPGFAPGRPPPARRGPRRGRPPPAPLRRSPPDTRSCRARDTPPP